MTLPSSPGVRSSPAILVAIRRRFADWNYLVAALFVAVIGAAANHSPYGSAAWFGDVLGMVGGGIILGWVVGLVRVRMGRTPTNLPRWALYWSLIQTAFIGQSAGR